MKKIIYISSIYFVVAILFAFVDWSVDGFDFFKLQSIKYYFQSWISIAGSVFALVMSVTIFIIYKKSELVSLKFVSLSFLLISIAYGIISYHTSYCKACSDLSLCGASHTYPNYLIIIALIIFVTSLLLANIGKNIELLKLFSYGLMAAVALLMVILFISIEFMETPDIAAYILRKLNMQGFIFLFPSVLVAFAFIYFKSIYKLTNSIIAIFLLIFISSIPQAYHIFICNDCHIMECSEFYIFAGLFMFLAIGLLVYSTSLELKKNNKKYS